MTARQGFRGMLMLRNFLSQSSHRSKCGRDLIPAFRRDGKEGNGRFSSPRLAKLFKALTCLDPLRRWNLWAKVSVHPRMPCPQLCPTPNIRAGISSCLSPGPPTGCWCIEACAWWGLQVHLDIRRGFDFADRALIVQQLFELPIPRRLRKYRHVDASWLCAGASWRPQ